MQKSRGNQLGGSIGVGAFSSGQNINPQTRPILREFNIHPIEAGIVAACRASQGGTGDVAILSASKRMNMMPYAQVATRIGGAITVTLALALFAKFGV